MPLAQDQHPVGNLSPGSEHEPFRVSVRARAARGIFTASIPASPGVRQTIRRIARPGRGQGTGSPRRDHPDPYVLSRLASIPLPTMPQPVGAENCVTVYDPGVFVVRPPSRSRRRTRPAAPSPAGGYIRGTRQVYRRSSGQDHFAAFALPDSCTGTGEDYGSCPPPMPVPDPALRSAGTFIKRGGDHLPHWRLLSMVRRARSRLTAVRFWVSTTWLTQPLSCVVDTLSVVVCPVWPAQIPLSLPLFDFASRTERSAATCARRRRPGRADNLREDFR